MNREDFLHHVGWTGAGIAFGISSSGLLIAPGEAAETPAFHFVQISDSHIGFSQPANDDVTGTLTQAIAGINALPVQPAFVVHTGDITHLSKPAEFDTAKGVLSALRAPLFVIPGEHDVIGGPATYAAAYRLRNTAVPWYSFDRGGTHFVSLVNVYDFENAGKLGTDQLDWLRRDLASKRNSTPIVVFTHAPLYALYPAWGWTTEDGAQALALLARFEAVTVLAGHIHQITQAREGNIRFFTANATAYPQPAPGTAKAPGPLTLPHDHLLAAIGYRTVTLDPAGTSVDEHTLAST